MSISESISIITNNVTIGNDVTTSDAAEPFVIESLAVCEHLSDITTIQMTLATCRFLLLVLDVVVSACGCIPFGSGWEGGKTHHIANIENNCKQHNQKHGLADDDVVEELWEGTLILVDNVCCRMDQHDDELSLKNENVLLRSKCKYTSSHIPTSLFTM